MLRASENEDCTLTTDETLKLQDKKMTLSEYVSYLHGNGGVAVTDGGNKVNVEKIGSGSQDFNFTWTGDESGTAVNMFIKGEQGVNIAFSKFSTLRRTLETQQTQQTLKDNFPNWHFYQRRDVTPSDITQFSGVYEGVRKEQEPKVISAEWTDIDEENHMCAVTKVTGKDFIDYIYVSDDLLDREFEGISFSGELAILRLQNGNPVWGYVYSDGSVTYNGFSVQGNHRQEFTVSQTANEYIDGSTENKLVLDTEVQSANDLQGRWMWNASAMVPVVPIKSLRQTGKH